MPYAKDHKARTRQRIVASARRLFATRGFARTAIEDVMADCALTRGGFYAHFDSKRDLYRAVFGLDDTSPAPSEAIGFHWLAALLAECARPEPSSAHEDRAWTFLAADAASDVGDVRAAYAQALRDIRARFTADHETTADGKAWAWTAMVVGAAAAGATLDDIDLRRHILDACHRELSGPGHVVERVEDVTQPYQPDASLEYFWSVSPS